MYFIHYFYVTVTDATPKCPRAESPASSWPCAELSRRRIGGAESAAPSCPIPVGGWERFWFALTTVQSIPSCLSDRAMSQMQNVEGVSETVSSNKVFIFHRYRDDTVSTAQCNASAVYTI